MTALHWSIYRYALPLTDPLPLATGTLGERAGLLVRVQDADGHEGWGEVAPLPGFSRESLEDAFAATWAVLQEGEGVHREPWSEGTPLPYVGRAFDENVPPSVRFGVDGALAALASQRMEVSLAHLLCPEASGEVTLNALLLGSRDEVLRKAVTARKAGYAAVKLKVGRQAVEDDINLVRAVQARLGSDVRLRLDANRAWSLEAARTFAAGLHGVRVDYIEEPLSDPTALATFAKATGLPVALDETVQVGTPDMLRAHPYATAVVLKPTLLGGVARIRGWMEAARMSQMRLVFSAAFESGIGMRLLLAMASAYGDAEVPVGFDTYRWLADDLLHPRLSLDQPRLDARDALPSRRIRTELLDRV
jgi:O-succinylbenzoate synthase